MNTCDTCRHWQRKVFRCISTGEDGVRREIRHIQPDGYCAKMVNEGTWIEDKVRIADPFDPIRPLCFDTPERLYGVVVFDKPRDARGGMGDCSAGEPPRVGPKFGCILHEPL